jgi:phosphate-selective porin OprO and OprP
MIALVMMLALVQAPPSEKPAEKPKDGLPLSLSYNDGIWFKTDDGKFTAVLNGRLLAHYRAILDRPDDNPASAGANRTQPDSLFFRQARIDLTGTFMKQFEYRIYLDFATGQQSSTGTAPSSSTGTVQDAFLGWRPSPDFGIRIGQFKEPFSQEQTTTLRATDFAERSILDRLVPARDLGVMIHGKPFDGILEYELGAFNGAGRAVADNNDEKEAVGRLRVSPFKRSEEGSLVKGVRFGVAGTIGDLDASSAATTGDPLDLTSTELGIKFLDAGPAAVVDGRRSRIGLEFTWLYEFLGLRAEWVRRTDTLITGPGSTNRIPMKAYSVSLTALLTGEKKTLEDRIVPDNPFDLEGGWGAFELAARYAALRADDDVLALGASAASPNANAVQVISAGVNWYLTRNVRITPDFIYERYNRDIGFANGVRERTFKGFLVRFQIDF